jgi:hypothetical protein
MSTIITRIGKGTPLTNAEVDANFTNLNTDKVEAADTRTLTNKTISGANNTLSNIGNASLTNSAITFGSTAQALGSTVSALNGVSIGATTASTGAFTTLSATGVTTVQAGTVSAPAITTSGDTNTGIFFPAADTIAFTEGGVEAMRIDSAGNVGIGTTAPGARLEVASAAFPNVIFNRSVATGGSGSAQWVAGQFKATTTEGMSQGFGVATEWVLRSSAGVDNTAASISVLRDGADNSGAFTIRTAAAGTNTERMRIDNAGNVGIGTSSPNLLLSVSTPVSLGNIVEAANFSQNNSGNPTTGTGTRIIIGSIPATNRAAAIEAAVSSGLNGHHLAFLTNAAGAAPTEKMRITSAGDVGIGTSSVTSASGQKVLEVSTTLFPTVRVSSTTGTAVQGDFNTNSTNQWVAIGATTNHPLIAFTNNTERMRITSAGNVGIGTTSPGSKLDVYGTIHSTLAADPNYYAALTNSGGATQLLAVGPGATMQFWVQGSERARIDSSGNLLVGTTATTSGARSRVNGSGSYVSWIEQTSNNANSGLFIYLVGTRSSNTTDLAIRYGDDVANRFQVLANGDVQNTNNSYGAVSDAKLKENIVDATPKLEKLNQVRVVNFNLIGEEQKQLGVIAQELEQIFPGMVAETPDRDKEGNDLGTTTKSVKYSVFVPMLIKAMQEQQAIINDLKARLDAANL